MRIPHVIWIQMYIYRHGPIYLLIYLSIYVFLFTILIFSYLSFSVPFCSYLFLSIPICCQLFLSIPMYYHLIYSYLFLSVPISPYLFLFPFLSIYRTICNHFHVLLVWTGGPSTRGGPSEQSVSRGGAAGNSPGPLETANMVKIWSNTFNMVDICII